LRNVAAGCYNNAMRFLPLLLIAFLSTRAFAAPNFVLVMADDQGWGDMAYNGHPVVKTPNFDALARTGLRFDRFYAGAPVCSPTRASVLTGRTPNRMGCFQWGNTLRPQEVTIAQKLQQAGYATGHFGKWHLGSFRPDSPVSPGRMGFEHWFSSPNFFDLNPWMCRDGRAVKTEGEGSMVTVDAALEFIKGARDQKKPFLAVVWFGSPHDPHVGTPEDLALYPNETKAQQNYCAEITAMDRAFGKLRAQLRELKIADDTLLWYCSDNGATKAGSTGGLRGYKDQIYEGGLRVPGLIEWPARLKAPRVIDVPCSTVDIFPTLMEYAGLPAVKDRPMDGLSLAPLLEGKMPQRPQPLGFWRYPLGGKGVKSGVLLEELAQEQAAGKVRPAAEVEPIPPDQLRHDYPTDPLPGHAAWLDNDWKLHRIVAKEGGAPKWELYNLAADRTESKDRAADEPERVKKMQGELEAWMKSVIRSLNGGDYAKP
jgi:arylsulfatase A-like enzyme